MQTNKPTRGNVGFVYLDGGGNRISRRPQSKKKPTTNRLNLVDFLTWWCVYAAKPMACVNSFCVIDWSVRRKAFPISPLSKSTEKASVRPSGLRLKNARERWSKSHILEISPNLAAANKVKTYKIYTPEKMPLYLHPLSFFRASSCAHCWYGTNMKIHQKPNHTISTSAACWLALVRINQSTNQRRQRDICKSAI